MFLPAPRRAKALIGARLCMLYRRLRGMLWRMPKPDIQVIERKLREVFGSGDRDLAVHVARLSVLFEDLRLEQSAARHVEPISAIDTLGKNYRSFYFLRRMLVTLDEFASALNQINRNPEWKKMRARFDTETEHRWDAAVKYYAHNRPKWSNLRNQIGGHFKESAARFAVENFRDTATGNIEIVRNREKQIGGIRLCYAEEIVAVNLSRSLGPGQHSDADVTRCLNDLFTVMMTATNEAVKAMHEIAVVYVVDRFERGTDTENT